MMMMQAVHFHLSQVIGSMMKTAHHRSQQCPPKQTTNSQQTQGGAGQVKDGAMKAWIYMSPSLMPLKNKEVILYWEWLLNAICLQVHPPNPMETMVEGPFAIAFQRLMILMILYQYQCRKSVHLDAVYFIESILCHCILSPFSLIPKLMFDGFLWGEILDNLVQ